MSIAISGSNVDGPIQKVVQLGVATLKEVDQNSKENFLTTSMDFFLASSTF